VFIVNSATPLTANIITQDASAIVAGMSPQCQAPGADIRPDRDVHRYAPEQTGGSLERPSWRRTGVVIGFIAFSSERSREGRVGHRGYYPVVIRS
jgi:hypothetical protein